ncbi:hypothetical protein A4X03_0g9877 [Tilletia caries]|uniref:Uncharacterized protein n=3 Tax=Tilletia TaxID=13289 RepID=A0A8T8S8M1_9BASI|nr:hypothetical protein A4X03_0g9877 [Tilletia caries]
MRFWLARPRGPSTPCTAIQTTARRAQQTQQSIPFSELRRNKQLDQNRPQPTSTTPEWPSIHPQSQSRPGCMGVQAAPDGQQTMARVEGLAVGGQATSWLTPPQAHVNNPRMALDSFALPSSSPSILDLDGRAGRRRHLLLCQQRRPGLLGRRAGASIDGQAQQATGRRLDRLQAGQTRQAQESSRFRGGQAPDEWMAQSVDLEGVQRASSYSGTG